MSDLSIIIPSYNTKEVILRCLESLYKSIENTKINIEIMVVDNGSSDGSIEMLEGFKKDHKSFILIENKENQGFAKANNIALKIAQGKYILFLNSDVIINNLDFRELINYIEQNPNIGAMTVKVILPTGGIDQASHRGFPTLWNSFCYFTQLEKMFGRLPLLSNVFGGYHMTYCDLNKIHEIDSATGAFYLTSKEILEKIGGFSEDFFMYGEDLDLSFRIKQLGFKVIYYPLFEVMHLKYSSGLKVKNKALKQQTKGYFYDAMKIFYQKHYEKKNLGFLNKLVYMLIDIRKKV